MATKRWSKGTVCALAWESTGEVVRCFSAIRRAVAYVGTLRDKRGQHPKAVGEFVWEIDGKRIKLERGITYEQPALF